MRIGVISDTHIPERAKELPETVIEGLKGVDMIVHAGDLTDTALIDKLRSLCPSLKIVRGNMDRGQAKIDLPEKELFKAGNYKIGLAHGYGPAHNLINMLQELFKQDKPDIIIFGHSHAPCNEKKDGILFFNPGSPTDKVFAPYNSYGIIEINDKIEAKVIRI